MSFPEVQALVVGFELITVALSVKKNVQEQSIEIFLCPINFLICQKISLLFYLFKFFDTTALDDFTHLSVIKMVTVIWFLLF